mgnify:CR=1 FL=1
MLTLYKLFELNHSQWVHCLSAIIVLGFIPSYTVSFSFVPVLYHVHAVTAFAWLAFVNVQAYSAQRNMFRFHRFFGYATLVAGLAFTISTVAVFLSRLNEKFDKPAIFHLVYWLDLFLIPMFIVLFTRVFLFRKAPLKHRDMVVSMMMVLLPPGLGRLIYTLFLHPFNFNVRYFYEPMLLLTLLIMYFYAKTFGWSRSIKYVFSLLVVASITSYPAVYSGYF